MAKNLVIVESPAKAKTIEGFLGDDFVVKSSYGHIRDLVKKGLAVDIEKNFAPQYEVSDDKKAVVSELKKMAGKSSVVWLATDEDREGEAISWHLCEALGLDVKKTKRIVFHEITKSAILNAIENPRTLDINLVNAQQARRILDRLVGFELSPILWKKVKPSLSAGRVQSVAVRLIVEREREITGFNSVSAYKIVANFLVQNEAGKQVSLKAEFSKRIKTYEEAKSILEKSIGASFEILNVEKKPAKRSPSPPFTTSTLQQEASRKLGYSVSQTMILAQKLYESGKITYMRTDSVNLSETAINASADEIKKSFGKEYLFTRNFKTKSKGAQEAHEAIRPTYFNVREIDGDSREKRLYDLIWKRTVASQMADAVLEKTTANIRASTYEGDYIASGEVLKFDGFLKVYSESSDDENDENGDSGEEKKSENSFSSSPLKQVLLPPLNRGQLLDLSDLTATEKYSHALPRYTEASLVKKLEELGIGRPSTYAPTISTVQKRGYVVKEDREGNERKIRVITLNPKALPIVESVKTENTGAEKSKLFPTDIGMVVTDFLVLNFASILDYNFTAEVEKEFDDIAQGAIEWTKMIRDFYDPFHKTVASTETNSARATGERMLGVDPSTGKPVSVRIGRFGPVVQMGSSENEQKPQFASLRSGQRLENITLEDALELLKLPRNIGKFEGEDVLANAGRFGPYIKHKGTFYSLAKTDDMMLLTIERAEEIILAKRKALAERLIKDFPENPEVQILNGRWGPYLAVGKQNVRLPKGTEPASLTLAECLKLAAESESKPSFGKKPGGRFGAQTGSGNGKTTEKNSAAPKKMAASKKASATKKSASKKK